MISYIGWDPINLESNLVRFKFQCCSTYRTALNFLAKCWHLKLVPKSWKKVNQQDLWVYIPSPYRLSDYFLIQILNILFSLVKSFLSLYLDTHCQHHCQLFSDPLEILCDVLVSFSSLLATHQSKSFLFTSQTWWCKELH